MSETFADIVAYGGGRLEFRVRIEGCPLEFCTTEAMAGVIPDGLYSILDGVRRVGGLLRDGLTFSESAYLPGADYKASVGSITIEDTDESVAWNLRAASSAFSKIPRRVAHFTATALAADTAFSVSDPDAFEIGRVYHADTEAFRVDGSGVGGLSVTRGMWGTTAQAHYSAASTLIGDRTIYCPIFDAVPTYRRRRVWIYAHGPGELSIADTGTLVFRGVIAGAPQLSEGTTWSLSVAPLTTLLDSDIGPRDGQAAVRGVYYAGAAPLRITASLLSSSSPYDVPSSSAAVVLSGFWETQAAFCEAVSDALNTDATISTWGVTFSARPVGDRWELFVRTGSPALYVAMGGGSAIDGKFVRYLDATPTYADPSPVAVSPDTEYVCRWMPHDYPAWGWGPPREGLRGYPRSASYESMMVPDTPANVALYPAHRVYLASVAGISVGDVLRVNMPETETISAWAMEATIATVSADYGYIEWDPATARAVGNADGVITGMHWLEITPATMPEIVPVRDYGDGVSLAGLLEAVWTDAPDAANAGTVPFILEGDFASITTLEDAVAEAAAGAPWLLRRTYRYASAVKFADVVKHECRLAGLYLATDSTGAITLRPLTTRLDSDVTIGPSDLVNDMGLGELVTEPDGVLTGLTLKTGYDAFEDEHKGTTHEVTALVALGQHRARTALEIAPKSRASGSEPTYDELVGHAMTAIQMWSGHRAEVSIDVGVGFYGTLIGDVAYCTIPQLPYDGERSIDGGGGGMIGIRGTVVGRSWQMTEPAVTLTIVFDSLEVAGYTPAGRITAQSGSATTWTITLDADEYGPGGSVQDASFFAVGMKVRIVEWDAASPTVRTGTVTDRSGNDLDVELDSSWTPGGSTWNVHYAETTTSGFTTTQQEQALIGRATGAVELSAGSLSPKMFAP